METLLAFLATLAVLIVVHELGHFAVARLCGVRVLKFSIGFGPVLWRWQSPEGGTEWALSAVPLGGFVRMLDERDPETAAAAAIDPEHAFNRKPLAQRTLIVLAGPLANFVLAVLLYTVLNLSGVVDLRPVLALPPAGSAAAAAGVREGDTVLAVDEVRIDTWSELPWRVVQRTGPGDGLRLTLLGEDGATRSISIPPAAMAGDTTAPDFIDHLGFTPHPGGTRIHEVARDGAADRAGLLAGDRIVSIDGTPTRYAHDVAEKIRASAGRQVAIVILRRSEERTIHLTPDAVAGPDHTSFGRIGVDFSNTTTMRWPPAEALERAVDKTLETSAFSLQMLGKMVSGSASWHNISGPLAIADFAGQSARIGWQAFAGFLALISTSLFVLNLLPVPLLDGGHLLYYAVELFTGKAPSERAMEIGQRIGAALLISLTVLAVYNDLTRLLS